MKKIVLVLLATAMLVSMVGCSFLEQGMDAAQNGESQPAFVSFENEIKGKWVVIATPDPMEIRYFDNNDTAKLLDSTLRANVNGVFPKDGIIEFFDKGICSCNGVGMEYEFVADDAIMMSVKNSGLIFKLSKDDNGNMVFRLNDSYDAVLAKKE